MYDPMGEFFPRYGTTSYGTLEDPPATAPYEESGRYGEDTGRSGPWLAFPTTEGLGTWGHEEVLLPRPRAPLDDAALHSTGLDVPLAARHRRRAQPSAASWSLALGELFGVLTAVTVTAVWVLGWMISYDPLQDLAQSRVPYGLSHLWPVIVYGPWLVGCLSVLRAALEGRRPLHSWVVVVIFSGVATGLCILDACRTVLEPLDIIIAGLPPITAAISLHQLVRQFTAAQNARRPATRRTARRASR